MLPFYFPTVSKDISNVKKVLKSTYISEGKLVKKFESKISKFLNIKYCVSTNSGTSALHLALAAAEINKDDEVIIPTQTFIATGLAVLYQRAKPIFADINVEDGNISIKDIKKKITKKTKAIVVVHWGGYPCEMDEILKIARKNNIKVIEDAAHCFGGKYKKRSIGSISDFTCFSFQATKHLTTGDGGLVACKNKKDYLKLLKLRWFGFNRKLKASFYGDRADVVTDIGFKYHMNDYSASLGLANLKLMKTLLKHHENIGKYYSKSLKNIKGLKLLKFKKDRKHTYWFYQILVSNRRRFIKKVRALKIPCSLVNFRIDKHDIFRNYKLNLPGQEKFELEKISLPVNIKINKKIIDKLSKELRKGW